LHWFLLAVKQVEAESPKKIRLKGGYAAISIVHYPAIHGMTGIIEKVWAHFWSMGLTLPEFVRHVNDA
jgi:hypothetical protein